MLYGAVVHDPRGVTPAGLARLHLQQLHLLPGIRVALEFQMRQQVTGARCQREFESLVGPIPGRSVHTLQHGLFRGHRVVARDLVLLLLLLLRFVVPPVDGLRRFVLEDRLLVVAPHLHIA